MSTTWPNPLILHRADPHVTLHSDGNYYFTASVPEYDRIELRRARSLAALAAAEPLVVWSRPASGAMGGFIWAPELHYIEGTWYLYVAAGDADDRWRIRMYVLANPAADPFTGTWSLRGQIKTDWDSFSLDATTFEYRGVRYLSWAQAPLDAPGTNLYLAQMDTSWSITGPPVLISAPTEPWERIGHHVNEGPAALIRDGRLFLTYSASATDANYCMGLLTAATDADLLNPESWSKSPHPIFKSSDSAGQYGPGHNSFTTTPDGRFDIMVYHARGYERIEGDPLFNPDRHTRAQIVQWNADGSPDFGMPVSDGPLPAPIDCLKLYC